MKTPWPCWNTTHLPARCAIRASSLAARVVREKTEATKIIMKYLARITRKGDKPAGFMSPDGKNDCRAGRSRPVVQSIARNLWQRADPAQRQLVALWQVYSYFTSAPSRVRLPAPPLPTTCWRKPASPRKWKENATITSFISFCRVPVMR